MKTKVLIKETETYYITCVLEEDEWKEILAEPKKKSTLHNIYTAKVTSVSKNMDAAFVSTGDETCYLPFKECGGQIPKTGDERVVQVIKERIKTKDAVVSCNLTLNGQYFVLTTGNKKTGVSAKITDPKERKRLAGIVSGCLKADAAFGAIVRTNARGMPEEILKEELEALCLQLDRLCTVGGMRTCYSVLYKSPPSYLEKIRDIESSHLKSVITDSREVYDELKELYPAEFYEDPMLSMDKLYRFETNLSEALAKKVWLNSGGYLVIEPTEALTVIDVNTGKYTGKKTSGETYKRINMDAAKEIARQLRLRNLSGIIIVDFINMEKREDEEELKKYVSLLVREDKIQTEVAGMTPLGLMEITRKKVRKSLRQQLEEAGYEIYKYQ